MQAQRPRGRPPRYAHLEELKASLVAGEKKRATYRNGIGLLKGARGTTAFVKITFRQPNAYKGKHIQAGESVEIRLGALDSWTWDRLEAERVRLQGLADRGEAIEAEAATLFSTLAQKWLDLKEDQPSWGVSNGIINSHLNPTFGKKAVTSISVGDVDQWVAAQRKVHRPATVQRQMTALKAILNYGVKLGLLDSNPCQRAEPVRGIESRQRYLTADERQKMFDAAQEMERESETREKYADHEIKGWLFDFLMWALHSGMRRGEIVRLELSDIRQAAGGDAFVFVEKTKSGKPRYIQCNGEMLAIAERMKALPRDTGDQRLFPVSLTTVKRKLTKFWASTGLEDVRLHDLRRTHVTELVSAGVNLHEIAARVGHSNLNMLEDHYAVFKGDAASASKAQELFGARVVAAKNA